MLQVLYGYGMVDNNPVVGTVIGKAVGTQDGDEQGSRSCGRESVMAIPSN